MSGKADVRPVLPADRVNDVLARDESLVEVFVRHSAHFAKLRNRAMRKVMGRLVTVEDAARIAAVPVEALVRDLNAALGIVGLPPNPGAPDAATASGDATVPRSHPRNARVVEVDVRDDLRQGREPFARIMSAVGALGDGEVLRLRAIFHPAPLLAVLAKRGFANESEQHAADDWSVWFWRDAASSAAAHADHAGVAAPAATADDASPSADADTVWLDVRGLQPPEPLVRTLAELETLPAGAQLIQLNERVPQLLLPMLAERGFACELDDSHADRVLLRIWRPA